LEESINQEMIMFQRISFVLLCLGLMLTACKSKSGSGTATALPSNVPQPTNATPVGTVKAASPTLVSVSVPSCTVVSFVPTPDPTSLFPPVTDKDWVRGLMTATVTIVEYGDFQ
jgi:hypothetical protein